MKCKIADCTLEARAVGLCRSHYMKRWRGQDFAKHPKAQLKDIRREAFNSGQGYCIECKTIKPLTDFWKHNTKAGTIDRKCKSCRRGQMLLDKYNLTLTDFDQWKALQQNECAICYEPFGDDSTIHVDHCHKTGKVRGLLCQKCNQGLGLFRDNVHCLESAKTYLESQGDGWKR